MAAATGGGASLLEYFEPEASATFCIIPSGVRSRSERAVIWTWYPCDRQSLVCGLSMNDLRGEASQLRSYGL